MSKKVLILILLWIIAAISSYAAGICTKAMFLRFVVR